jgi:UrcA family protein
MSLMVTKIVAAASAAAAACALMPSAALAETKSAADPAIKVVKNAAKRVNFADLDLTSRPGQRMLVTRVKGAVSVACKDMLEQPAHPSSDMSCRIATWRDTRPQVNRAIARSRELALAGHTRVALMGIAVTVSK